MKTLILLPIVCLTFALEPGFLFSAEPNEDAQIAILKSDAPAQQKDAACAQLKRIGTSKSVPALAGLLTDQQLAHSARYALESLPGPEAEGALIAALEKTSGAIRLGVISTLGNRRDATAVPGLSKLLADADANTSSAAAGALGRIGGKEATIALQWAFAKATEPTRAKVIDGLLACANKALAEGDRMGASMIFQQLYKPSEKDLVRIAAYNGLIRAGGEKALSLVLSGIQGQDAAAQIAALQLAREVKDANATRAFCDLLPNATPAMQWALIEVLAQRGDPGATPALAKLAQTLGNVGVGVGAPATKEEAGPRPLTGFAAPDGEVHGRAASSIRIAAITALGMVGDASVVPMLAEATASKDPDEQKAAQTALMQIKRGNVSHALLSMLTTARPDVQVQIINVLSGRGEKSTLPKLMDLARSSDGAARKAAFRSLGQIADAKDLDALVQLLLDAKGEAAATEAEEAVASICQRFETKRDFDVSPIIAGLKKGSVDARVGLLNCCSLLIDPRIRAVLRDGISDAQAPVRSAALRAMCNSRDTELLSDVMAVAQRSTEVSVRSEAIRGAARLATEEGGARLTAPQKVSLFKQLLAVSGRLQDKYVVLAALANVPHADALQVVTPMLDDPTLQTEAAQAAAQIAGAIRGVNPELATSTLEKIVVVMKTNATQRAVAESILNQINASSGFITAWQYAGPYEESGKGFNVLFDTVFAPEKSDGKVTWKLLPAGTNPQQPYVLDLLKAIGGEQKVAYARTRVFSPKAQKARLELGSDDGVKVWLNGKMIYAHNIAHALRAGSDKVDVDLQEGWNTVMLKVTQNNMGWEFCARFVKPDGERLGGLKSDLSF